MTTIRPFISIASLSLACALGATTGCQWQTDAGLAEDATASVSQAQKSAGLTKLVTAPIRSQDAQDEEQATTRLADESVPGLYPAGCVQSTRTGAHSVHVEFDDCSGPFGLVHLKGGIDVEVTFADGTLVANLADSGDLTAEGFAVDYSAEAKLLSFGIEENEIGWTAHWEAETPQGSLVTTDSDVVLLHEPLTGCITIDGTSASSVDDRGLDLDIDGYAVCPLECPADGTILATGLSSGKQVTIEFDGTDQATVVTDQGYATKVQLVCLQ